MGNLCTVTNLETSHVSCPFFSGGIELVWSSVEIYSH